MTLDLRQINTMDDYERLLREGTERRKQDAFQRQLLVQLNRDAERDIGTGIICLVSSAPIYWLIGCILFSEEMMKRSDAFILLVYGLICASLLHSGVSAIYKSPKDIFLRDLLEEKMKMKNEPNQAIQRTSASVTGAPSSTLRANHPRL